LEEGSAELCKYDMTPTEAAREPDNNGPSDLETRRLALVALHPCEEQDR
jgi:hypothetical protein